MKTNRNFDRKSIGYLKNLSIYDQSSIGYLKNPIDDRSDYGFKLKIHIGIGFLA